MILLEIRLVKTFKIEVKKDHKMIFVGILHILDKHTIILKPESKSTDTSIKPFVNIEIEEGGAIDLAVYTTLVGLGDPALKLDGAMRGVQYLTLGQSEILQIECFIVILNNYYIVRCTWYVWTNW